MTQREHVPVSEEWGRTRSSSGFVPFFAWPRLDGVTPVVVSLDRLCIGACTVTRSEDRFPPDDRELEDSHAAATEAERRLEPPREQAR